MADRDQDVCPGGNVPLRSHARCASCRMLMGCAQEAPPTPGGVLCGWCVADGHRVSLQVVPTRTHLRPPEVAPILGVSHQTVLRLIRAGKLKARLWPGRGPSGRRFLVERADLEAFLTRTEYRPTDADPG